MTDRGDASACAMSPQAAVGEHAGFDPVDIGPTGDRARRRTWPLAARAHLRSEGSRES
jgi:hypothetical protein